jgi:hypothetical protein
VPVLAADLHDPPEQVDRAVAWAVANRLATRALLPSGEHIALTESGIANVGLQRRLSSMIGPDGQIDVSQVGEEIGRSWQAMQEGRAAEAAQSVPHVPADLPPVAAAPPPVAGEPPVPFAVVGRSISVPSAQKTRREIGVGDLVMFGLPMLLILVALVVDALAD